MHFRSLVDNDNICSVINKSVVSSKVELMGEPQRGQRGGRIGHAAVSSDDEEEVR